MKRLTNILVITVIITSSLANLAFGQTPANENEKYVAEVIGKNVYIRSGDGMNFYRCGKLSQPQQVVVVAEKNGWSMVQPPKGSFSWISMRYVDKDPADQSVGIVKGDNVRVWTGSPYVTPLHSQSMQIKLNTGDKVRFFAPDGSRDEGGYYCIYPPEGAHLWINSTYMKKLGPLSMFTPKKEDPKPAQAKTTPKTEAPAVETPKTQTQESPDAKNEEAQGEVAKEKPVVEEVKESSDELKAIEKIAALSILIEQELNKPLLDQDFTGIKSQFDAITKDEKSGKAIRFAQFRLTEIQRYQTAQLVAMEIVQQDVDLLDRRAEIKSKLEKTLVNMPNIGEYTAIGTLYESAVYSSQASTKRYILKDQTGRIIAYAAATDKLKETDIAGLIGKKVGLNGTQQADTLTPLVLVKFDAITEIK